MKCSELVGQSGVSHRYIGSGARLCKMKATEIVNGKPFCTRHGKAWRTLLGGRHLKRNSITAARSGERK